MSRKFIAKFGTPIRYTKVYRDSEAQEFVARLYENGNLYEPADYFTNDKDDALHTAETMAKENV